MITLFFLIGYALAIPKWHQLEEYDFERYCADFGKSYNKKWEYTARKAIFDQKMKQHKIHNADKTKTWKQGVNQFTDLSQSEIEARLGAMRAPAIHKKFLDPKYYKYMYPRNYAGLGVDWRQKGIITAVKDQGRCGSCWSFAAAETVEAYFALSTGHLVDLSEQQILDCTANPDQCGGTGGCGGATAELAYQAIMQMGGLSSEWTYGYSSYFGDNGQCNTTRFKSVAKITGYVNLPMNDAGPIMNHLLTTGPLAVSVDASSWGSYETGVFDGCNQTNPDLDHAVQLVGFGTDPQLGDYWLIRNSWSPMWGEEGYLRIRRTPDKRCGNDLTPRDGDGCTNGTATEYVCGTCGVLFDALYPTF